MESIASTALGFSLEDLKIDGSLQDELGVLPTSPQAVHPFMPPWQTLDQYDHNVPLLPQAQFEESCGYSGMHRDALPSSYVLPESHPSGYYSVAQGSHGGPTYYPEDIPAPIDPLMFDHPHDSVAEGAFASQYLRSSSVPSRQAHSRMARPFAPSYIPCAWVPHCGILLDDLSSSGIARHLKEHHFQDPSDPWHPKSRGHCQWSDTDGLCSKELNYASFGKHIAAVHLQSTARACPYCFQQLGRADSLERHMKNYCSRSGRAEKKS